MTGNQVPDSIKRDVAVLEAMAAEMEPYQVGAALLAALAREAH